MGYSYRHCGKSRDLYIGMEMTPIFGRETSSRRARYNISEVAASGSTGYLSPLCWHGGQGSLLSGFKTLSKGAFRFPFSQR